LQKTSLKPGLTLAVRQKTVKQVTVAAGNHSQNENVDPGT
jgi:hypothetical protein